GRKGQQFGCVPADGLGAAACQTIINQQVCAHRPTKLPQGLLKAWLARLYLRISRREGHEHADTTRALALLRARRQRPCGRAPEQRDKLAPPHVGQGLPPALVPVSLSYGQPDAEGPTSPWGRPELF